MDANLILKVIDYLSKKGYSKTESMLRIESANQDYDGRPLNAKSEETGGVKYLRAFGEYSSEMWWSIAILIPVKNLCSDGLMRIWISTR